MNKYFDKNIYTVASQFDFTQILAYHSVEASYAERVRLGLMRRYAPLHAQREAALRLRNDRCIFNFVEVLKRGEVPY
jgi:hypothetical protein